MRKLQVVVGLDQAGEEIVDEFVNPYAEFTWITERSGVLSVMDGERAATAYAPGAWLVARYAQEEES
ncbi:hypothetical protein [Williamsia serinedens]|uniref:Uncharacterized protein n=1 Tax=Williamsia serinedens TaxID=391736 RepID=A0ABT1H5Z8_9NOCA|nr:hypothetical protein [Williamsia serinedens]MCP2162662.1 hypothetical protein [Williamsia serinedens]